MLLFQSISKKYCCCSTNDFTVDILCWEFPFLRFGTSSISYPVYYPKIALILSKWRSSTYSVSSLQYEILASDISVISLILQPLLLILAYVFMTKVLLVIIEGPLRSKIESYLILLWIAPPDLFLLSLLLHAIPVFFLRRMHQKV
jgi:hypothetical protein